MSDYFYAKESGKHLLKFMELHPQLFTSFLQFNQKVFEEGALSLKTKELIALACAHVTRCPYCIDLHLKKAEQAGASQTEIAEAVYVAVAMSAGASMAHCCLAMESMTEK